MGIGAFLLLWAVAGWVRVADNVFQHDTATNIFNTVAGCWYLWLGFGVSPNIRHAWATKTGVIYALIGVAGLVLGGRAAPNLWIIDLGTIDSVAYLVLGLVMLFGGLKILTEDYYVIPPRYRTLMATRAVRK
jgi:hypothetical protein